MEANHLPFSLGEQSAKASANHQSVMVEFRWAEVQKDGTLVDRYTAQYTEQLPFGYIILVNGEDDPVMRQMVVSLRGVRKLPVEDDAPKLIGGGGGEDAAAAPALKKPELAAVPIITNQVGEKSYRTWQTLGRQVRKGERGIQILAPVTYRPHQENERDRADSDEAQD